jgi:hypothetical protein
MPPARFCLETGIKGLSNLRARNGFVGCCKGMPQSDFMASLFMASIKARVEPHPGIGRARRGFLAALLALAPAFVAAGDAPPRGDARQAVAPATPLAVQPFDSLRASRERPLFSPTRRPPAPPPVVERRPDPPPPPPPPPNVALFAVVVVGDDARAVVRTAPGADVTRVRTGDDIGGWTVARIESQRLVLSLDGRLATFTMFAGNSRGDGPPSPAADLTFPYQSPPSRSLPGRPPPPGAATPPRGRRPYP